VTLRAVLLTSLAAHATAQSPGCSSYIAATVPQCLVPDLTGYPVFVRCWMIGTLRGAGRAQCYMCPWCPGQVTCYIRGHLASGLLTAAILMLQFKLPYHPTHLSPLLLPYSLLLSQHATTAYKLFFTSELQQCLVRGLEGSSLLFGPTASHSLPTFLSDQYFKQVLDSRSSSTRSSCCCLYQNSHWGF